MGAVLFLALVAIAIPSILFLKAYGVLKEHEELLHFMPRNFKYDPIEKEQAEAVIAREYTGSDPHCYRARLLVNIFTRGYSPWMR